MRIGASKLTGGNVPGTRWTILRRMAPAQRQRGRLLWQHRHLCRCVCGDIRVVWEFDLLTGRSTGCSSAACRHDHQRREAMTEIERLRELADRRMSAIDELIAEINNYEQRASELRERIERPRRRRCA